jgi:glutamate-5-semialdehyde dehydrogenase
MTPDTAVPRQDLANQMQTLGYAAKEAALTLSVAPAEVRNAAITAAAAAIRDRREAILAANGRDMTAARAKGLSAAMLDRLELDDARIESMAEGLEDIAAFPDPIGKTLAEWTRPNGLQIARVTVPLGVIGIIYESRPNVTADAGGLCLKAANAAILRGGSESFHSSGEILACLREGLVAAGLPAEALQRPPVSDREAVGILLSMSDVIDVIVPRGGRGLIERVRAESHIPVISHLDGLCHTYIHKDADPDMARELTVNAKMRRTGICGATETLLVDREAAALLPAVLRALDQAGCALRGNSEACMIAADAGVTMAEAQDEDWDREYLDAILSVRIVDGLADAIDHINHHGSHHTEAIITEDAAAAASFIAQVDAGIVMHNTSTQFADGGEFGMGAEIGISTGKLHARGPVGANQLTSYKYIVRGQGQARP